MIIILSLEIIHMTVTVVWQLRLWPICNCICNGNCFGEDPVTCLFEQKRMRQHLYKCFVAGKMEPFPHRSRLSMKSIIYDVFDVHCHCRMPEIKNVPMVECTGCTKWFHICCTEVELPENVSESDWLCCTCSL